MTKVSEEQRARYGEGDKLHRVKRTGKVLQGFHKSRCGLSADENYWHFVGNEEAINVEGNCMSCERSTHLSAYWDRL